MSDKNGNRKAQFYLMFTLCFIYSGHFSFLSNNRSVGPVEGVSLPLTRVTEAEWPEERGLEAALPPSRFPNRELEEGGQPRGREASSPPPRHVGVVCGFEDIWMRGRHRGRQICY